MLTDIAKQERTAVFIDGASFWQTARLLQIQVDYKKMREYFADEYDLLRIDYFAHLVESEEYSPLKPVLDWLSYNGYAVHIKNARETFDSVGRSRIRGNDIAVDIAVAMLELPAHIQHIVLFSGDADFTVAVKAMQRRGVRVTVISSIETSPPSIADELRRQADQFFEFREIAKSYTRKDDDSRDRTERTPRAKYEARQLA